MRIRVLAALTLSAAFVSIVSAQSPFKLKAGDRVVFYGDSITDQRLYTTFVESYVITRFPSLEVTFTHSGWGGDRVGGGGGGNIDLRLERDVLPFHPTVLTIMLGMNDGGYKAFDETLSDRYQTGYKHIIDSVRQHEPACRIFVIEPSPYDDVTRAPLFPGGYNAVLIRYSDFLKQLAAGNQLETADLNTPVVDMLKRAKTTDAESAQKIIPDRVHPGASGHLIMAMALLKAWNAPALVSDVDIDAGNLTSTSKGTTIAAVTKAASSLEWDQSDTALPMPIDWSDHLMTLAVASSDLVETLDRETLRIRNVSEPRAELKIDGAVVGTFTREQFNEGVNLARLDTPMLRQSLLVHRLTLDRAAAHNIRWRQIQVPMKDETDKARNAAITALDNMDHDLARLQRDAARPHPHHYQITPLK